MQVILIVYSWIGDNMKKIGIVTMYNNNNYGSALQCFATIKLLRKLKYDPIVIERKDSNVKRELIRLLRKIQFLYRIILYPEKWRKFKLSFSESKRGYNEISTESKILINKFINENIPIYNLSYIKLKKLAHSDKFYAFISGSDQIWNVSSPYLDPMLYLEFSPKNKRIALAPSFGIDEIPYYEKKNLAKRLNGYAFLSVRENSGVKIIRELTGRSAHLILDPTLLVSKEEWINFTEKKKINKGKKYILAYFLNEPNQIAIELIKKLILDLNCELIVLPYDFKNYKKLGEYKFYSAGPKEFINLINESEFIVTDSFHGVAFSINLNKNFIVVERDYIGSIKQNERIITLLEKCGLENRFFTTYKKTVNLKSIRYSEINTLLKRERINAENYILNSLKGESYDKF